MGFPRTLGKTFSRYWMHNGFVNINNEKMSKSLQNFKTLRDIVQKPFDARAFRYLVVSAQYRSPINFNEESINSAKNSLKRLDKLVAKLEEMSVNDSINSAILDAGIEIEMKKIIEEFEKAFGDDLNSPRAFAALFKLIGYSEKLIKNGSNKLETTTAKLLLSTLKQMDQVFGLIYEVPASYFNNVSTTNTAGKIQENVVLTAASNCLCGDATLHESANSNAMEKARELAIQRIQCKAQKLYKEADALRAEITALGYGVKDVKDGFELYEL